MVTMNEAVSKIDQSAEETARIVNTIDEIAFQTNLLALNAAVEAARAGDAGKGFAVVAEEVRNLAQRSAEAARETTVLLSGARSSARDGVEACGRVDTVLGRLNDSLTGIVDRIDTMNGATKNQTMAMAELKAAVDDLGANGQKNAAASEESAAVAEELNAQTAELYKVVADLAGLVGANVSNIITMPPMTAKPSQPLPSASLAAVEALEDLDIEEFMEI